MQGKEHDVQLAEKLRNEFISKYKSSGTFQQFLNEMPNNCIDRMIHCLKQEVCINIFRDYNALKAVAQDVINYKASEIYDEVCAIDEARKWINDNGKYDILVFESLYKVYRKQERLQLFIDQTANIKDEVDAS